MISINSCPLNVMKFPDGTPKIDLQEEHLTQNVVDQFVINWYYDSMEELFTVAALAEHYHNMGERVVLHLPYVPNARMDRTKNDFEVFTLKWFADIINSLPFSRVYVLDPHSYVTEALINKCTIQTPKDLVKSVIQEQIPEQFGCEIDSYFFPDEGAMKRYSSILNQRPYTFGMKNRDWKTGEIKSLSVEGDIAYVCNKNVLIVDDICSAGGTFYFSAKKLKEIGANKVFLYVTHCENTLVTEKDGKIPIDRYDNLIDAVYTTNSIYRGNHEKVRVIKL